MSSQSESVTPSTSSASRKQRNQRRFDNHREKKSTATDEQNKKLLYEKLFFGFNNMTSVMQGMQVVKIPRSVILPVSTRGIGFTIRYLIQRFARLNIQHIDLHQLCASLYRITLLMFEFKVAQALQNQTSRNLGQNFANLDINIDVVRVIGTLGSGLSPLQNLISSVGIVKAFGTQYIPRVPILDGFDPTVVTFSSLRDYVNAMSNPLTAQEVRQYFYDHDPFPCSIWNVPVYGLRRGNDGEPIIEGAFPILQNPDHILPQGYALANVRDDVEMVMTCLELVGRKYPKFVHMGRVDFDSNGLSSMLVSNGVESAHCAHLANPPQYNSQAISGNVTRFWSPETLSDPEFYLGMLHLLGELPRQPDDRWALRSISSSKESADNDLVSCLQNMVA